MVCCVLHGWSEHDTANECAHSGNQLAPIVTVMFVKRISSIPFHSIATAEAVLEHFRDDFIKHMDANAVVLELYDKDIIGGGDKNSITENKDPTQQSQILHLALQQRCTDEALLRACGIIIAVKGNPKMRALSESMKKMLTGKCTVCARERVCVCIMCV